MDLNQWTKRIDQIGLTHRKSEILALARPQIALRALAVADEDSLNAYSSRIGGLPTLPAEFSWPYWKQQPLEFVAQLNMVDVIMYDTEGLLPRRGMLYFFYNPLQWIEGQPYEDGMYRVLFFDGDLSQLQISQKPSNLSTLYPSCSIEFDVQYTLVPPDSLIAESHLSWAVVDTLHEQSDARLYRDLIYDYSAEATHDWPHAMFGYPNLVQGDVFSEAYWAKTNPPSGRGLKSLKYEEIEDWQLLLQIDSDSEAGMMWGDVGMLYFCIEKDALQSRRFNEVITIMQSC